MKNNISFVGKYILYVVTYLFVISFTLLKPVVIFASNGEHGSSESIENELKETETKFDAGELIFDHILD